MHAASTPPLAEHASTAARAAREQATDWCYSLQTAIASFPTTRWTLISAAAESPEARAAAWQHLVRTYWPPLYAFLRARGLDAAAASDAVQGLYVELLERDVLSRLDPARGSLRGFLKVAAQNHLWREHEKSSAQRRGGATAPAPLDVEFAERLADPSLAPDAAFDRAWAQALFDRALARLEEEWGTRAGSFEVIAKFFAPQGAPPSYAEVCAAHGLSLPQLKSLLHRARLRFRELVEAEVADTVSSPDEVAGEVSALLEALSS